MTVNLKLFRLITFAISWVFAAVLLGINAHMINLTLGSLFYFDFSALTVAAAVFTIISLLTMFSIDRTRKGAISSWVTIEFAWLTVLWIFWLAVAARTSQANALLFSYGDCNYIDIAVVTLCSEFAVTMALSFCLWILLMGYTATIMTFAIIGSNRGNRNIWKAPVSELMLLQSENLEKESAPPVSPAHTYPPPLGSSPYPPATQQSYPIQAQHSNHNQQSQAQYQQLLQTQYTASPQPQHTGYPQV